MHCPKCQNRNPPNAKFCNECGTAFNPESQPSSATPFREAERKRITALFSDLSGYTAMSEKLDPEEVKEITSHIFDETKEIIKKYEGSIEMFAGDGILALFGVPIAHEDDPLRAIRAAREIHDFVESLNPLYETKVGRALSMHSGINTGLAVTADMDPEKGTHGVTGDAINLASRLSDLAGSGYILIGTETYRACQGQFSFEALNPVKVKGKSHSIPIYKLLSGNTPPSTVSHGRQVFSEMVGRDREIDKLELQVMKAINGEGSVVNISGEAGIGKSRLIAELKKREVMRRVTFLEGRAISIGRNLSFHPIINLFKHWANIVESDSEARSIAKLKQAIRTVHSEGTDEILPFVGTLMGMKLWGRYAERVEGIEGEALEKLILKNLRDLMIKGSELQTMVIVMEDLHWADDSSLGLLQNLYGLTEKHRLLFINVFRPGYLGESGTNVTSGAHELIDIQSLGKQDSEALINNMLEIRGLPFSIKEQILDRAGGNPFFIEEVVHSLIDDGMVVRGSHGFEVTKKIDQVVIPPTINDVLMARIDRLEEETRELVKVASVIGRSFFDRILKDVADSIDKVDDRLSYLKDVQLIRERKRLQELEYLFSHALTQEAAYESTLLQQRKVLHLKVAQSIEKVFQERLHEFYGMLAHHYGLAEDADKTEEYMTKAGEEALKSSASSEALNYLQEALKLYLAKYGHDADPEKLANLEKNIAIAYHNKARWAEAVEYFDKVLIRWGTQIPKSDSRGIASGLWGFLVLLKVVFVRLPSSKQVPTKKDIQKLEVKLMAGEALVYFDPPRMLLAGLDGFRHMTKFDISRFPKTANYWSGLSTALTFSGVVPLPICNRLLEIAKRYVDQRDISGRLRVMLGSTMINAAQGEWGKINVFDEDFLNSSLGIGEFFIVSTQLRRDGLVKTEQGEFTPVQKAIDRLDTIGENYDQFWTILIGLELKVNFLLMKRFAREALSVAEKGVLYAQERGNEIFEMLLLGFKAEAYQFLGDLEDARDSIFQAAQLHKKQHMVSPFYLAPFLSSQLFVNTQQLKQAMQLENDQDVVQLSKRARVSGKMALKNAPKCAQYRTKTLRLVGDYYWLMDKQEKALKWWDKAIHECERLGARPDLSRTYFEVGKRLLDPENKHTKLNGVDANSYLEKAETLFDEMGLVQDMDDLKKLRHLSES